MISLKLTRWLIGWVRFDILGGSPERFYTNCARSGAVLWDIAPGTRAGACVAARRYRLLHRNARRAGCRLRVRERRGLPFLLRKTRLHPGLWAGCAAFLIIVFSLSLRVWSVDVTGNEKVPAARIEQALETAGLTPGVRRSDIDPKAVSQSVLLQVPELRWMSVNLRGSTAEIAVREKTAKPKLPETTGACNVKAAETGQILIMRVFAGTPAVKQGDAVVKGQLLVSGVVVDQLGGNTLVRASAEVTARTQRSVTATVPLQKTREEPTGETLTRTNLNIFGARLPLTLRRVPGADWRAQRTLTRVSLFGTALPLSIYEEKWERVRTVREMRTKEQARCEARQEIQTQAEKLLKNGRVTQTAYAETWSKDVLVCKATLTCEENIAQESVIYIK